MDATTNASSPLPRVAAIALIVGGLLWMLNVRPGTLLTALSKLHLLVVTLPPILLVLGLGCLWAEERSRRPTTGWLATIAEPTGLLGLGLAGIGTILLTIDAWQSLVERTSLLRAHASGLSLLMMSLVLLTISLFRLHRAILPLGSVAVLFLAHVAWGMTHPPTDVLARTKEPFYFPSPSTYSLDLWLGSTWVFLGTAILIRLMPYPSAATPPPSRLPRLGAWFGLMAVILCGLPIIISMVLDPLLDLLRLSPRGQWPGPMSQILGMLGIGSVSLSYLLFAGATLLLLIGYRRQMTWRGWSSLMVGAMGPMIVVVMIAAYATRLRPPQVIEVMLFSLLSAHPALSTTLLAWDLRRQGHGRVWGTTILLTTGLCGTLLLITVGIAPLLNSGMYPSVLSNMMIWAMIMVILAWACFSANHIWGGRKATHALNAGTSHPTPILPAGEIPPA